MRWEKEAERLLRRLGANGSYKGFWFTVYGIARTVQEPELLTYMCKGLYVTVAHHFNVSLQSAERNIRTLKLRLWRSGNRRLMKEIFGKIEKEQCPKNAVFIDGLAAYLRECCLREEAAEDGAVN